MQTIVSGLVLVVGIIDTAFCLASCVMGAREDRLNDEMYERFLSLTKEYGAEIWECEPGQGGVFVQGERINSVKELFPDSDFCPKDDFFDYAR